jgi:glycine/D-amino acid oxidase-like deaminating enzyme
MKIIVIGAGIFGVTTALKLSNIGHRVTLVDSNNDIMQNASRVNHNRLHFGFHYPRSRETAAQSLEGYMSFYDYFNNAITTDFDNYYMIEKNGNVNSGQYERFCDDLNLEYKKQYPKEDVNFDNIESSYLTREPIFDYDLLKLKLDNDLRRSDVNVVLNKKIIHKRGLEEYDVVVNTTYFNINKINRLFGLDQTPLRMQTVVIPIFKCNMERMGLTIMDGKFCSIMPKGFNRNTFLLYHAKESIVYETEGYVIPRIWHYGKEMIKNDFIRSGVYDHLIVKRSTNSIVKESEKYLRFLCRADFVSYWQTVRALPINDNDERLSLFRVEERENQRVISVLSGKISTCFLIAENVSRVV